MTRLAFLYKILFSIAVFYLLIWVLKYLHIGFINQLTPSMPEGWYFTYPVRNYVKGDDVVFIPGKVIEDYILARKWLPEHIPLIKKIVGVPGDFLCIRNQMVFVNGQKIAEVSRADNKGNLLPEFKFCAAIPEEQYFMQGVANEHSFDSRYYGLIHKAQMMSKAVKL